MRTFFASLIAVAAAFFGALSVAAHLVGDQLGPGAATDFVVSVPHSEWGRTLFRDALVEDRDVPPAVARELDRALADDRVADGIADHLVDAPEGGSFDTLPTLLSGSGYDASARWLRRHPEALDAVGGGSSDGRPRTLPEIFGELFERAASYLAVARTGAAVVAGVLAAIALLVASSRVSVVVVLAWSAAAWLGLGWLLAGWVPAGQGYGAHPWVQAALTDVRGPLGTGAALMLLAGAVVVSARVLHRVFRLG